MYGGNTTVVGGGALAVTGLGLPFGWYFVVAAVLLLVGFLLVRVALRHRSRIRTRHVARTVS